MISLNVDTSALARYTKRLKSIPPKNKAAIARALNEVGNGVVRELAQSVAKDTRMPVERVRALITTHRASAANMTFSIRMKAPAEDEKGTRKRGEFVEGSLVIVVTRGDDKVCQVCQDIADGSPYTIEDARALIPHGGPLGDHNCRCELRPFYTRQKLQAKTETGQPMQLTMKQLAAKVREYTALNLRAM